MAKIQVGHPAYGSGCNVLKMHNSVNDAALDLIDRGYTEKEALDGIRESIDGYGTTISQRGTFNVTEIYFRQ